MPEVQWDDMELKLANDLPKEIQDALGQSWLPIILTRSKRVKWRGGGAVQVEVQTLPQRERSRSRSRCEGKVTDLSTKRSASANSAPKSKAQKTTPSPPSPKLSPQAAASEIEAVPSSGGKQELTEWLRSADPAGRLLKYEAKLTENLDELTDILVFVRDKESAEPSTLDKIDPWFFKCIECTQAGHKMLLAKAIMRLHAESAQWAKSPCARALCGQKTAHFNAHGFQTGAAHVASLHPTSSSFCTFVYHDVWISCQAVLAGADPQNEPTPKAGCHCQTRKRLP